MSRTRLIRPGFFENEELCELPFEFRLLFAGLWTLADKAGRLEDRPRRIKAKIFPYDAVNVAEGLTALARRGFIQRYAVEGAEYIQITTWARNQSPHNTEAVSVIPPAPPVAHALDNSELTVKEQLDNDAILVINTGTNTDTKEGASQASPPPTPLVKEKKPKETSYPDGFTVTADMREKVHKKYPDLDIDSATEEWELSMRANRTKYRYSDWESAWINAMGRADGWQRDRGGTRNGSHKQEPTGSRPPQAGEQNAADRKRAEGLRSLLAGNASGPRKT
jgi:hypothetical protein